MQQETLEGVVERITYYSDESGYTVLRLRPNKPRYGLAGRDGLLTVVGTLPELQPGETVRFTGVWSTHKDFGKQFKAESVQQTAPATLDGLQRYLGSGLIKGIGPVSARRIVDHFGMQTLDILEEAPLKMLQVPGIGKYRATLIAKAWEEQRSIKEVMLFLQSHRVSTSLAVKIFKAYGDGSIAQVTSDPYRLARDIYGIGFKTADQIARNLGLPPDSPARIAAGVVYALESLTEEGHVYAPRPDIVEKAADLLGVDLRACDDAIERLLADEQIMFELIPAEAEGAEPIQVVYLRTMYFSEKGAANRLLGMIRSASSQLRAARTIDWPTFFRRLTADDNVALTEQQQDAVRAALLNKISILTGGPGTGKTTTLRAVIHALESIGAKFALASPTGRAAKRLSEATGHPAKTIHRLLGFKPGEGFIYNENNPLKIDMLVIDETSMVDLVLFYNVLKALTPEMHLMLVGDVDQLPSVGAGDVLRDVIQSGVAHVTRLDTIFRQAGDSLIITNAHRVNQGHMPDLANKAQDFYFFKEDNPDAAAELVVDVVQNRIPTKFGLHPINDVQVLVPMYRGAVGVQVLNEKLQAALNPLKDQAERRIGGRAFRVGDKVMQTRNDYDKDVYNGDIGRVYSIDFTDHKMRIAMDGRFVDYDWNDADELLHAFAVSVHRSQGGEYPAIVIPMVTQHYMLLQRNLLYTAITRAKQLVVLVGSKKAIHIAVSNDKVARRYSGLAWRLGNPHKPT